MLRRLGIGMAPLSSDCYPLCFFRKEERKLLGGLVSILRLEAGRDPRPCFSSSSLRGLNPLDRMRLLVGIDLPKFFFLNSDHFFLCWEPRFLHPLPIEDILKVHEILKILVFDIEFPVELCLPDAFDLRWLGLLILETFHGIFWGKMSWVGS